MLIIIIIIIIIRLLLLLLLLLLTNDLLTTSLSNKAVSLLLGFNISSDAVVFSVLLYICLLFLRLPEIQVWYPVVMLHSLVLADERISTELNSRGSEMPQNFLRKPEIIWSQSPVCITALNFSYELHICSPTTPPPYPATSAPYSAHWEHAEGVPFIDCGG
jgi:hypothetical protein